MNDHPIQGLMTTAMESIKEMVDVNTIIGDAIVTPDGTTIIPVSKVSFGFASGGSDYPNQQTSGQGAFGGGSGAGITITPIAFLVSSEGQIRLMHVSGGSSSAVERLVDMVPDLINKIAGFFEKDDSKYNSKYNSKENCQHKKDISFD